MTAVIHSTSISIPLALTRAFGQSGRRYLVERILQDKPGNQGRVYLGTSGEHKYVLKSVAPRDFKYFKDMFDDLRGSPYLRVSVDTCPDASVFVYKYLRDHLLSFVQNNVSLPIIKRILRDALRGIAALHGKGIVHTDIKANNILIDWKDSSDGMTMEQLRIADLVDAAYAPKDCVIRGRQVGNPMWRSPDAHASAEVHTPSDMFSFGLVCSYAITNRVVLAVNEEEIPDGIKLLDIIFERQLSYFSDLEGVNGLIQYLGDSLWAQLIAMIAADSNAANPRRPFALWQDIDPDSKDLVVQMMNVNPTQRLTADEALAHKWFSDIPE